VKVIRDVVVAIHDHEADFSKAVVLATRVEDNVQLWLALSTYRVEEKEMATLVQKQEWLWLDAIHRWLWHCDCLNAGCQTS
jgi:hypothetical protein